jgi:hypothetical protein
MNVPPTLGNTAPVKKRGNPNPKLPNRKKKFNAHLKKTTNSQNVQNIPKK